MKPSDMIVGKRYSVFAIELAPGVTAGRFVGTSFGPTFNASREERVIIDEDHRNLPRAWRVHHIAVSSIREVKKLPDASISDVVRRERAL